MMNELRNQIEEAYLQCHLEVSGNQPNDMDVRIVRNHIVIMRIDGDEPEQSPISLPVYGEDGHPHASVSERDRLHILLKQKLSDITGFEVTSIQSDIFLDTGEKLDLIHFESDVESKFVTDWYEDMAESPERIAFWDGRAAGNTPPTKLKTSYFTLNEAVIGGFCLPVADLVIAALITFSLFPLLWIGATILRHSKLWADCLWIHALHTESDSENAHYWSLTSINSIHFHNNRCYSYMNYLLTSLLSS